MSDAPLNVALLGLGTVGTGVAKVLLEHPERITRRAGRRIDIRHIVVRDAGKNRDIELPDGVLTDDIGRVLQDNSIDVAVELMGGIDPTREIVTSLLTAGRNVVTANKALVCAHGPELFRAARDADCTLSFEAAVAGGIPIIAVVSQSMAGNQLTSIEAILNGTSNFILTEMLSTGRSYTDVLADAQRLGYAEADPAMDVDGTDAAQKLCILAQLAFGTRITPEVFPRHGIDHLEPADLQYADELGYAIRLVATAKLVNDQLELHVQPTLVRHGEPLARNMGPSNIVVLHGDQIGRASFSGPGAGRMPTASAVLADLIDVATGRAAQTFAHLELWHDEPPFSVQPAEETSSRYYLRLIVEDRPHVLADITAVLGRHQISLASVIQHEAPEPGVAQDGDEALVPLVITTHRTTEGRFRAADRELDQLGCVRTPRIRMPVAD